MGPSQPGRPQVREPPGRARMAAMERKPNQYMLAALAVVHVVVVVLDLADIRSRTPAQVRGAKKFWLVVSSLNMGNAAVYWLVGRRRSPGGKEA